MSGSNREEKDDEEKEEKEAWMEQQHRELMEFLTNNSKMRETARNSLKQGLWAGGSAVLGGLLLGPVGGMVGGVLGSVVGYMQSSNYDGVVQHMGTLSHDRRNSLVEAVRQVLVQAGAPPLSTVTRESAAASEAPSSSASASAWSFSPGAFQEQLVRFASRAPVRDQIWAAVLDVMKEEEGRHEAGLTS